ncbi:MAG: hypothetical protein ACXWF8_18740 [Methylobacter sp.]
MNIIKTILYSTLLISCLSTEAAICEHDKHLNVYFLQFSTETFMPISFSDLKKRNDNFTMREDDFFRLILESKLSKQTNFFENIRMRVRTKKGIYFINIDGVIFFRNRILGQIDKKILNSLDFGYGLYNLKTCSPYNVEFIDNLKKYRDKKLLDYLNQTGELADWRHSNFVGYEAPIR